MQPLKDMSFKIGSGDLVKSTDSPRGPRSKDLDGVPLIPKGINNAADAAQSQIRLTMIGENVIRVYILFQFN